jgi:hypothetical protein
MRRHVSDASLSRPRLTGGVADVRGTGGRPPRMHMGLFHRSVKTCRQTRSGWTAATRRGEHSFYLPHPAGLYTFQPENWTGVVTSTGLTLVDRSSKQTDTQDGGRSAAPQRAAIVEISSTSSCSRRATGWTPVQYRPARPTGGKARRRSEATAPGTWRRVGVEGWEGLERSERPRREDSGGRRPPEAAERAAVAVRRRGGRGASISCTCAKVTPHQSGTGGSEPDAGGST